MVHSVTQSPLHFHCICINRLADKEQKCEEEGDEKNHKVAHLEQSLVNTEKHLHQLRVEVRKFNVIATCFFRVDSNSVHTKVDSLKKKAYGSSHSRNSGGVTVRNHHYNSHLWRDYLIFSAIRHSRLYRRHWWWSTGHQFWYLVCPKRLRPRLHPSLTPSGNLLDSRSLGLRSTLSFSSF